jgi:hypothetical protein
LKEEISFCEFIVIKSSCHIVIVLVSLALLYLYFRTFVSLRFWSRPIPATPTAPEREDVADREQALKW